MADNTNSKAICILGAHRSGTSTVTRGLNLLGVWLGQEKDLMKPLPENPEGFWERLDVYYLQERALAMIKRTWDATVPLPENWYKRPEIELLKDELSNLVQAEFSGEPLWAWKDPRTCLLLPLWKQVLNEQHIDLKVLFIVRNPLDVARSLKKRNGFPLNKGFGIWFNNTISALNELAGFDAVFLSYDGFLDDWETELRRCADGLGIAWPADASGLRAKFELIVRRDLRHSLSGIEELHAIAAPEPVIRLYSLLLEMMGGEVALEKAAKMIAIMYQEFYSYAELFEYDVAALADCRTLLDERAVSAEILPVFAEMKKELDSRTEWALKLNDEIKKLREETASLRCCTEKPAPKLFRILSQLLRKVP